MEVRPGRIKSKCAALIGNAAIVRKRSVIDKKDDLSVLASSSCRELLGSAGSAQSWLECSTDNRVVAGSNPAEAVWKLWQFFLYPTFRHFANWCLSEDTLYAVAPFYLVRHGK